MPVQLFVFRALTRDTQSQRASMTPAGELEEETVLSSSSSSAIRQGNTVIGRSVVTLSRTRYLTAVAEDVVREDIPILDVLGSASDDENMSFVG